ncbi:hypothetical protein Avbf_01581 [Armadillidium vulgare]|nr:hypothetical protein Avbf_01581 [Armadillidium vulgare]
MKLFRHKNSCLIFALTIEDQQQAKPENFKSTNLNQEITKVESPIQVESVAGEGEGPQVCDLVSTSQDSMLMSRSQDSTTPLIVSTKTKQYQNPTPPPQFTQSSSTHHKNR